MAGSTGRGCYCWRGQACKVSRQTIFRRIHPGINGLQAKETTSSTPQRYGQSLWSRFEANFKRSSSKASEHVRRMWDQDAYAETFDWKGGYGRASRHDTQCSKSTVHSRFSVTRFGPTSRKVENFLSDEDCRHQSGRDLLT